MAGAHKFLERNGRISKVTWPELFLQDEEETEISKGGPNHNCAHISLLSCSCRVFTTSPCPPGPPRTPWLSWESYQNYLCYRCMGFTSRKKNLDSREVSDIYIYILKKKLLALHLGTWTVWVWVPVLLTTPWVTSHGSLERLTVSSLQIRYEESTAHEAVNTKTNVCLGCWEETGSGTLHTIHKHCIAIRDWRCPLWV